MAEPVHIPEEAWAAAEAAVLRSEAVAAAAPYIYRAGQIAELTKLAGMLSSNAESEYGSTDAMYAYRVAAEQVRDRIAELQEDSNE